MDIMEEDTRTPLNSMPNEITLAEDGDVILILRGRRYRVSSVVLSLASPVFKTMFGLNFLEGQAVRSAEQPKEISLTDGHSTPMLLALMHFTNTEELQAMDENLIIAHPGDVAHIAGAADQYCCTRPMSATIEGLLRRIAQDVIPGESPQDQIVTYAYSATCAYLVGSKDVFADATRCLVLDGTMRFSELAGLDICHRLPFSVLRLEEQRSTVHNSIITWFDSMTNRGCFNPSCSAGSVCTKFQQEMRRILKDSNWPPLWRSTSIRSVLQDLDAAGDIALGTEARCQHGIVTVLPHSGTLRLCKFIREVVCGMCLVCARQDKAQSTCEHVEDLKKQAAHHAFF
ncbi:hypothetical protein LTS10_012834 [Elasticomyces elasticus]|nr:hypothetical protein LTS10_012834 [Elasticomyces elasticus]